LQNENIPHIALTAAFPNELQGRLMRQSIFDELNSIGINFLIPVKTDDFFELKTLVVDKVSKSTPAFFRGILFTAGVDNNKGQVLQAYLNTVGLTPDKIIFIDDSREHLDKVAYLGPHVETYQMVPQVSGLENLDNKQVKEWEGLINIALDHSKSSP